MTRATIALLTFAFVGAAARADCLILKKGGKSQVLGMPATVGKENNPIPITPENAELYADESTGVIEAEGYDSITFKRTATAKAETIPWSEVVNVFYSSEPDALVSGLAEMGAGQFLQAVGYFKEVAADPEARETFKYQALFRIAICYISAGRAPECIKHLQGWKPVNSRWTPEAFRMLAELLTGQRKYADARAQYDEIPKLPGIPDLWKFKARLGGVQVDIAERKHDDAEKTAQAIARETQGRAEAADANALALTLQAEAIWRAGKPERLGDAAAVLDRAAAVDGASPSTRAFLLVTQGNVIYAQGKPEEARFPYMRAALMYPDSGFDGLAYENAGQCFLDMSSRETKDMARSDDLFVKGMQLLGTAASRHKNGDAARKHRENKKRYDDLMAKSSEAAAASGADTSKPTKKG